MSALGHTHRVFPVALVAFCLSVSMGCDSGDTQANPFVAQSASASVASSANKPPAPAVMVKTTSPKLAIGNLNGQIEGMGKALERLPGELKVTAQINELLLQRARYLGRIEDFDTALSHAEAAIKAAPTDPVAYALRAEARAALHQFDDADTDLAKVRELSKQPRGRDLELSIAMARGEYDKVLAERRKVSEKKQDFTSWSAEAVVLARMGKLTEAEAAFTASERAYNSANPFPLAWLYYEWGSMYERLGQLDKAADRYRLAHARMPNFAHATAHLALLVPPTEGLAMLTEITEQSDDPEYLALLGKLQDTVKPGSGKENIEKAAKGFDALMAKHPAAYADHAARFWSDVGNDLAKAEAAAKTNLEVRKTPDAYAILMDVLLDKKDAEALCPLVKDAKALPYPTTELTDILARSEKLCKP